MEFGVSSDVSRLFEIAEMKRITAALENDMSMANQVSIAITSALQGEGKTLIASCLALQCVYNYNHRVLLVDLHWHAPRIHACFGLEQNFTLDTLCKSKLPQRLIQKSKIERLDVFTAPITEAEAASPELQSFCIDMIQKLSIGYDRIILDMGPVFPPNRFMIDPVILSRDAAITIMVLLSGVTPREAAKKATYMLRTTGASVAGLIMNHWKNILI